jgi:hypothetical protein
LSIVQDRDRLAFVFLLFHEQISECASIRLLQKNLVHVAPLPGFSRLKRLHDGMFGLMKMLGRMLVFGRVTTAHMAANKALPQMDPGIAHLQTLFAAVAAGRHLANFLHVRTAALYLRHRSPRWSIQS